MDNRHHYKRVRLLVDELIYGACSPCSFAVFPHGTVVLYSGDDAVEPEFVGRTARQYLRRHRCNAELPIACNMRGSPIWLMRFETACNGPTVLGVYFSQKGDDDNALKAAARQMIRARNLDAGYHAACTSSNPSERRRRVSTKLVYPTATHYSSQGVMSDSTLLFSGYCNH